MATWSTLDLLDADDGAANDALEWTGDDGLLNPAEPEGARGDDEDDERQPAKGHRPSTARELFVIRGEPTGTSRSRSVVSKKGLRPRPASATSTRAKPTSTRRDGGNQSAAAEDAGATRLRQDKHEEELQSLREQLEQTRRELTHVQEERQELQTAFRRLDQEITNGYNLTERKEKEMKIAELLTKNLKLSQMLEKELKNQEALRAANTDLQATVQRHESQTTLLNQVLASVETKHAALVEAHGQLMRNHQAAQERVASQQAQILQFEAKAMDSSAGQGGAYAEKLRVLESRYTELQRKLEDKIVLLRAEHDRNSALERAYEKLLGEKAGLEAEVASVHDKLIHMNGAMKTTEAAVEASSHGTREVSLLDRMAARVRILEEEMLGKNRLIVDLKESVNSLLSGSSAQSSKGVKRRHPGVHTTNNRSESSSSRLLAVTQRLRKAEEARDHKSRCLNVLLSILPQLLQKLDALQDKFHATMESNIILSHAIEQLQASDQGDTDLSSEPALALAREGYLLSGPYQPELLMGFTLARALSDVAPPPPKKQAKFMPFHVRTRVNISDNPSSHGELLLAADSDDSSGVTFLNRSKINAFLHFVQGSAAKAKCKHLLVQKIADLLSSQRDIMHNYSTESAYYKASVSKLEAEVLQRAKQLAEVQNELEQRQHTSDEGSVGGSSLRIKLLLKLVEAIAEGPQRRHSTFLTQADGACTNDQLTLVDHARGRFSHDRGQVSLDLSDCGIHDEDLEPLLLKLSVGCYRILELDVSDNRISDAGAATIAAFLETCPSSLRVLNLRGNVKISSDGLARLRSAVTKYPGPCRVETESTRHTLTVVAADQEFDSTGRPSVMLQIYLPEQAHHTSGHNHDQDQVVQQMINKLESLGFSGTASHWTRAEAIYRPTKVTSTAAQSSSRASRRTLSKASSSGRAAGRSFQSQHEKKFRALEAAIHRADPKRNSSSAASSSTRGVSLVQMQRLLKSHGSVSAPAAARSATLISSQRLAKLQFAQSHLATIRGLGKK